MLRRQKPGVRSQNAVAAAPRHSDFRTSSTSDSCGPEGATRSGEVPNERSPLCPPKRTQPPFRLRAPGYPEGISRAVALGLLPGRPDGPSSLSRYFLAGVTFLTGAVRGGVSGCFSRISAAAAEYCTSSFLSSSNPAMVSKSEVLPARASARAAAARTVQFLSPNASRMALIASGFLSLA